MKKILFIVPILFSGVTIAMVLGVFAQNKKQLFQQPQQTPSNQLEPNGRSKINQLVPRKK